MSNRAVVCVKGLEGCYLGMGSFLWWVACRLLLPAGSGWHIRRQGKDKEGSTLCFLSSMLLQTD